jgi:SAM-dependent methyltransferase
MSNTEQRDYWNARAPAWVRRAEAMATFTDVFSQPAMDALDPQPGWRVLDVGCGPGLTTIALARRVAPGGSATGADISSGMIDAARDRAARDAVDNAQFFVADAQTEALGDGYDGVFSRFGVMFFADPDAAFANIGRALRPGGRLSVAVWAPLDENPWMFVPTAAAAGILDAEFAPAGPGQPGPFALSDRARLESLMGGAGFTDLQIDPVAANRPVAADKGVVQLLETGPLSDKFEAADDDTRARAVAAVEEAIESYRTDDGWAIPGRSFTVTASRPR